LTFYTANAIIFINDLGRTGRNVCEIFK